MIFWTSQAEFVNIFFSWKITSFDLLSVRKKKRMLSYETKFSRHMRNMGKAVEYFMFFKWRSKILVCLCIFLQKFWVKNKGTFLFTNHFYIAWKEISLKIDLDPVGRGAFRENCYDFNETAASPHQNYYLVWIDRHFVGKSSFKRRTEVFSFRGTQRQFSENYLFGRRFEV